MVDLGSHSADPRHRMPALRVLHVEDSEPDARLIARELGNAGFELRVERVEGRAELLAALERGPWDLVLSDSSTGDLSGLEALALCRARRDAPPFVFVSGADREGKTSRALEAGAYGHVSKDRLVELAPVVISALAAARRRAASRASGDVASGELAIAMLDAVATALPDLFLRLVPDGTILEHHAEAGRALWSSPFEWIGRRLQDVLPRNIGQQVATGLAQLAGDHQPLVLELTLPAGGRTRHYDARFMPLLGEQIAVVISDVTERVRDKSARRSLLARTVAVQEEERRRIALDLHDQAGQSLALLQLRLTSVAALDSIAAVRSELLGLQELAAGTMARLRQVAKDLHPAVLELAGLVVALEQLADEQSTRLGLPIRVDAATLRQERLPARVELGLYRIAQEAMTNVARHAKARQVEIVVARTRGTAELAIRDDGVGFDLARRDAVADGHLGLVGMEERAALLGGELSVASRPGQGTTVLVRIPLAGAAALPGAGR